MQIPEPQLSRIRTYIQRIQLYTQLAKTEEALITQELETMGVDISGDAKWNLDIEKGLVERADAE